MKKKNREMIPFTVKKRHGDVGPFFGHQGLLGDEQDGYHRHSGQVDAAQAEDRLQREKAHQGTRRAGPG